MFTNLVLLSSYGVAALTTVHAIVGNWSGIASQGNFAKLQMLVLTARVLTGAKNQRVSYR